jgi:lysyl-tRNA synthetase class 2
MTVDSVTPDVHAASGRFPRDSADVFQDRLGKMERLREDGVDPFPHAAFPARALVRDLCADSEYAALTPREHGTRRYEIAGRVTSHRKHGKVTFLDVRDRTGSIELCASLDVLGEEVYRRVHGLDAGDIVGVTGHLGVTRRGEPVLTVHGCTLLAKALRPPPVIRRRAENPEATYAEREVDLLANERRRELFRIRSRTLSALREWMDFHEFIEVETPLLQELAGGAMARPFRTQANALERELALRISGQLYIKRCVVGDLERIYDLGKCFRNEGISHRHSPEFTMLEWSMSYTDYRDVMAFVEEMVAHVARRVLGTTQVEWRGRKLDLAPPWRRVSLRDAIVDATGIDILTADSERLGTVLGVRARGTDDWGELVNGIYAKVIEPGLVEPTIVHDFPVVGLPFAKRHPVHRELTESFDVAIGGLELASGDTELNDPDEQWERLLAQDERKGSEPAQPHDEGYVRALEYGAAPTAGCGVGIERLLMILTGEESIREVIPFPALSGRRSGDGSRT